MVETDAAASRRKGGIPRGLATEGPALLSYGFRPFFLGAGLYAVLAMGLWIGALTEGWEIGGTAYGPLNWHAHEMVFGYTTAALAGFMLTAIPNWTGRLPVSGRPLLALVLLWLAGRLAMLFPEALGVYPAAVVEAAFVPALAAIAGQEIISGRNWKNLKILIALTALGAVNIAFHTLVLTGGDPQYMFRAGISALVVLIALVGGRIVPSFTRNWLSKAGSSRVPAPFDSLDKAAVAILIAAVAAWTVFPQTVPTAILATAAAVLQLWRLLRWRGHATVEEPLVAVLHVAYLFVPIGMAGVALAALGWLHAPSALHLLTVGAIGNMTMAVMTRATLGHTGRRLTASAWTSLAYLLVLVAAVVRPFAELLPEYYHTILGVSAGAWIAAFGVFSVEYGRMLVMPRVGARAQPMASNAAAE